MKQNRRNICFIVKSVPCSKIILISESVHGYFPPHMFCIEETFGSLSKVYHVQKIILISESVHGYFPPHMFPPSTKWHAYLPATSVGVKLVHSVKET